MAAETKPLWQAIRDGDEIADPFLRRKIQAQLRGEKVPTSRLTEGPSALEVIRQPSAMAARGLASTVGGAAGAAIAPPQGVLSGLEGLIERGAGSVIPHPFARGPAVAATKAAVIPWQLKLAAKAREALVPDVVNEAQTRAVSGIPKALAAGAEMVNPPSEKVSGVLGKMGPKVPIVDRTLGQVLGEDVPQGLGASAPFLFSGGFAGGAALGALSQAGNQYTETLQKTGDQKKAWTAFVAGLPSGSTEGIDSSIAGGQLSRISRKLGGGFLASLLVNGAAEGLQEGGQQVLQDYVEEKLTGEEKDFLKSFVGAGFVGSITGGILGGPSALEESRVNKAESAVAKREDRVGRRTEPVVREAAALSPESQAEVDTFAEQARSAKPIEAEEGQPATGPAPLAASEGLRGVEPTTPAEKFAVEALRSIGKEPILVERSGGGKLGLAGKVSQDGKRVLLDANAPSEALFEAAAFHEILAHSGQGKALYESWKQNDPEGMALAEVMSRREHEAAGVPFQEGTDLAEEEAVGWYAEQAVGYLKARFQNPEGLARAFEKNPGLAKRVLDVLRDLIAKIPGLKFTSSQSEKWNKIRREFALTGFEAGKDADLMRRAADLAFDAYTKMRDAAGQAPVTEPEAAVHGGAQPLSQAEPTPVPEAAVSEPEPKAPPSPEPPSSSPVEKAGEARPRPKAEIPKPLTRAEEKAPLSSKYVRERLGAMAKEAGWLEEGGKNFVGVMARSDQSREGSTSWIPKAEWWPGRPESGGRRMNEDEVKKLVRRLQVNPKSPMGSLQRATIDYMVEQIVAELPTREQYRSAKKQAQESEAEREAIRSEAFAPASKPVEGVPFAVARPDILGFRSALEDAAEAKLSEKAPAAQILKTLENTPGVKPEEIEWSGLRDFLKGKLVVKKAEVLDYLRQSNVKVEEKALGSTPGGSGRVEALPNGLFLLEYPGLQRETFPTRGQAEAELNRQRKLDSRNETKFSQYQLPGGTNYRELLLTLPEKTISELPAGFSIVENPIKSGQKWIIQGPGDQRYASGSTKEEAFQRFSRLHGPGMANFTGGHFDTPNVLAHLRVNDRTTVAPGTMQAEVDEARANRLAADSKALTDLVESDTFKAHGLSGLDVHEREAVEARVVRAIGHDEIRQGVIAAVPVEVMNDLVRAKRSPESFFDDQAVLADSLSGNPNADVRLSPSALRGLVSAVARLAAKRVAMSADRAGIARGQGTTVGAGKSSHAGKRMLFIEEIQSDWAQGLRAGRNFPKMPFAKTWHELALKRAIRYAAENGYDSVGWTKGAQQVDRYNEAMRQNVDKIEVEPRWTLPPKDWGPPDRPPPKNVYIRAHKNGQERFAAEVPLEGTTSLHGHEASLEDVVGKDIARKIREKAGEKQSFEGEGLAIGGKGMQEFYDVMLPLAANKIGKVGGAEAGTDTIFGATTKAQSPKWPEAKAALARNDNLGFDTPSQAASAVLQHEDWATRWDVDEADVQAISDWRFDRGSVPVHSLPITPELRSVAMNKGFTRFAVAKGANGTQGFDVEEEGRAQNLYRVFVNDLEPLVRAEKQAPNKLSTPTGDTLETALSRMPGRIYAEGEKLNADFVKPLKAKMKEAGVTRQEADDALLDLSAPKANETLAKRHPRKFGKDITPGSGIRTSEAQKRTAARLAGPNAAFYRWLQDWNRSLNKRRLDALEQGQLISPEERAGWVDAWGEDYVPYRTLEDSEGTFLGGGPGLGVSGKEAQRREGRTSKADSPLAFSLSSALRALERAERNRTGNLSAELVRRNPGSAWGVTDDRNKIPEKAEALPFKEGGEQRWVWTTNEPLGEAFKRLAADPGFVKVVDPILRYMRKTITQWDPTFPLRNMPKDLGVAMLRHAIHGDYATAAATLKGAVPAAKGAFQASREEGAGGVWGDWYRKARDAGALIGWNESFDPAERIKELDRATDEQTKLRKLGEFMSDLNKATELGTRIVTYRSLIESGMPEAQAAMKTRRITVDFARRGKWAPVYNRLYLFTGANVQGTAEMLGSIAKNPQRAALVLGAYAGTGFMHYVLSRIFGDDDELAKLSEEDKARFYGVMIGKHRVGVMAPYGFNVFSYMGWKLGETLFGDEPAGEATANVAAQAINALDPSPQGASLTMKMTPTILRPFEEIAENTDFAGRLLAPPKTPFARVQTPEHLRKFRTVPAAYDAITTGLSKVGIEVSPEYVQHLARAAGGGVGTFADRFTDTMLKVVTGDIENLRLSDIPIARPFVQQASLGAEARIFYENLTRIEEEAAKKKRGEEYDADILRWKPRADMIEKSIKKSREALDRAPTEAARKMLEARIEELRGQLNRAMRAPVGAR